MKCWYMYKTNDFYKFYQSSLKVEWIFKFDDFLFKQIPKIVGTNKEIITRVDSEYKITMHN